MKQSKKDLLNLIKQSKDLSAAEKKILSNAAKDTEFAKSELEETKTELRSSKYDLKIEAALERVRAVALRMKRREDMPEVCKTISLQLQSLGVKEIRNVQTAIFYKGKGYYMNYEYYAKHNKPVITETIYVNHKIGRAFGAKMLQGKGKFFITHIKEKKIKDWLSYQKTTNVFIDAFLEKAKSLSYYWYSLGPVALGISTYSPLNEEEINLFKRFLKVFELSYTRYLDIEKAEAQAREAKIEASLEKVRAVAMSMSKPDDLLSISKAMFKELLSLGFGDIRNALINIFDDEHSILLDYDYSDFTHGTIARKQYNNHPAFKKFQKQIRKSSDAFAELIISGKELESWKKNRRNDGEYEDPRLENISTLYYYYYSIGAGAIGISSFSSLSKEKLNLLKRFRNIFNLSYKRYLDIAMAEAQAEESKIEASLERVRVVALSMKKPDELLNICEGLFKELRSLGFSEMRNAMINILDDEKESQLNYDYSDKSGKTITNFSYHGHPVIERQVKETKRANDAFIEFSFSGKELKEFRAFRVKNGERDDPRLDNVFSLHYYFYSIGIGSIGISTFNSLSEKKNEVLRRFRNVFDFAYRRYMDLALAEAQTKEARIETALERVRAVAMAMRNPSDLSGICQTLFAELKALGFTDLRNSEIIINNDKKETITSYYYSDYGRTGVIELDYKTNAIIQGWVKDLRKADDAFVELIITEKDIPAWKKYMDEIGYLPDIKLKKPRPIYYYSYSIGLGALSISSFTPVAKELIKILERFRNVFQLSYQRYIDIAQAEAQSREAQIELALERVRARTMAMQQSEEILDTATVLFKQFKELGSTTVQVSIFVFDEETKNGEMYFATEGEKAGRALHMELDKEGFVMKKVKQAFVRKEKSFSITITGKELQKYNRWRNEFAGEKRWDESQAALKQAWHVFIVFFSRGMIGVSSGAPISEETRKMLERFAFVFDQTFRRFLDLQKAEAQARESQIQLALERVRARTMAMQKSDELPETTFLLFQQLKDLGETAAQLSIGIIKEEDHFVELSAVVHGNQMVKTYYVPADDPFLMKKAVAAWKEKQGRFTIEIKGKKLKEYNKWRNSTLKKKINFSEDRWIVNIVFFSKGMMSFSSVKPISEEAIQLLERFTKVFEQTYTRFLDLQKAEAQAREAQIEVALERVRSRSLAMHKSDELEQVVTVLNEKLRELGVSMDDRSASMIIFEEGSKDLVQWVASHEHESSSYFRTPYFDHPIFNDLLEAKEKGADFFYKTYTPEVKNSYFRYFFEHSDYKLLPDSTKKWILETEHYALSIAYTKNSAVAIVNLSGKPLSENENDILKRFSRVFEQSYTRFLDLQKAEAQSREAQIELGLERVRARAMAMQKSDELSELVDTVFKELTKLDFALTWCMINIIDESSLSNTVWTINSEAGKFPESFHMKFEDYPFHHAMMKEWKARKTKSVYVLEGNEKQIYDDYLFSETEFKRTPEVAQAASRAMEKYVVSFSFSNFGGLQTVGDAALSETNLDILSRFGKVFDLTYTRFNDLKQAEAQARESQIQLALERVRARTMAMQKSDELSETVFILFQQFKELGENPDQATIGIINEKEKVIEYRVTMYGKQMDGVFKFSIDEPHVTNRIYKAWKENKKSLVIDLSGKALHEFSNYRESMGGAKYNRDEKHRIINVAFFSKGLLNVQSNESRSEESLRMLERFASVFEQTYTRFLDLKKAEAQSREAQIELALERVRSRTMAMHKSEEFMEVINLVSEQLQLLNIVTHIAGFSLDYKAHPFNIWMAAPGQPYPSNIDVPYREIPMMQRIKAAIDSGLDLYADTFSFEEKNQWLDNVLENTIIKYASEERKKFMLGAVGLSITIVMQRQIALMMGNYAAIPYTDIENAILKRFSMVFEQTYIRYLDLQKAEAQAKEAQIEAALEKVRSRSLSVHKSDEFKDVISVVFEKLQELEIPVESASINIYVEGSKDMDVYACGHTENGLDIRKIRLRYFDHPIANDLYNAHKNGLDFFAGSYDKEKNSYYKYQFEHGDLKELPAEIKERILQSEQFSLSMAPTKKNSIIIINNFEGKALSEVEISIQKRFAKVFEQAYIRFRDLQKAEAQAKEAQIEAALERVRSRSMGMQKSEDLKEVIQVVYEQFVHLNILIEHTGFIMDYKTRDDMNIWLADKHEVPSRITIPYFDSVYYNRFNEAKKKGEDFFATNLTFEEKNKFYQELFKHIPGLPEEAKEFYFNCPGLGASTVLLENVGLYIENFSGIPYSDEENNTLMRFGKVFQQTYTRFLDLQKAEAQARESQIELSLERVRAKTMAMHDSPDVGDTVATMFDELVKLGVKTHRCGILIYSEDLRAEVWTAKSNPDGKAVLIIAHLDLKAHPLLFGTHKAWKNKQQFYTYELIGDDLVKYYEAINNAKFYPTSFNIETLPSKEFHSDFYFPEGSIFAFTDEPIQAEAAFIFKRFAGVFGQTYRRYLDLQKAEAQAREAKIEASLERVRSKAMAMHSSDDLSEAAAMVFIELKKLGIKPIRSGVGIISKESRILESYSTTSSASGDSLSLVGSMTMTGHPEFERQYESWLKKENYFAALNGDDLKSYYKVLSARFYGNPEFNVNDDHMEYGHWLMFAEGFLFAWSEKKYSDDEIKILERFKNIVELTFRRYFDLKKAETQAREAQIEAGLERVRSRTLAMHKSDELAETAAVVFKQLIGLGIEPNRLYIGIIKDDSGDIEFWITDEDGSKVSTQFSGNKNGNKTFEKMYSAWWEQKKSIAIDMHGKELEDYFHYLSELKVPFKQGLSQKRRVQTVAYFSKGFIGIASPDLQPEETTQLLERFASVFNLTYTRFNDLQVAEAQTHKARIEVALERVRARALAMQQPEEIIEVAEVLRHEMGLLGVEELETSTIFIHDENSDKAECWFAIKDTIQTEKKLVADHISLDLNETWVGREMLKFYNVDENQTSIPMIGINRREWIEYCYKLSNVLSGFYGENIPDRIYHLYKFSNGAIGAASPGDISDESWELLSRAASVFSLAYSRFKDLTQARTDLTRLKEEKKRSEDALTELKATQSQLIQSEKMASLGELTAGIAHEIQNPLNFVNNFSEVNTELIAEMKEEIAKGNLEDAKAIANDISDNEQKINHHGKRAEAIVKGMLQHSRSSSGQKEATNINTLADEYLRLAYHGLRAKDKSFNALMKTDYDESIGKINIIPQDIGRVILNLITNAFYVVKEKKNASTNSAGQPYEPTVSVSTKKIGDKIFISVKDNGNGIPQKVMDKIFQPFFTTKPTGQGTGLGLSLSYDIIKAHSGEIKVETKAGEGTTFTIELPANLS